MKKQEVICYIAMVIISLFVLVPIILITIGTFTPRLELYKWPRGLIPSRFTSDSFISFAQSYGVMNGLKNSITVAVLTVIFSLLIGIPAGYSLSRFKFKGKSLFTVGVLTTRMFPIAILAVPLVKIYMGLGIYDSILGVAFIHTIFAFPFAILISHSIFASVPGELEEAAMVLGCSRLGAFRRTTLPLVAPGIAAIAIFAFIISWNEVFAATLLTLHNRTLPALIVARLEATTLDFLFASAFFMLVPCLVFIFIIRKRLLRMWGIILR